MKKRTHLKATLDIFIVGKGVQKELRGWTEEQAPRDDEGKGVDPQDQTNAISAVFRVISDLLIAVILFG